MEQWVQKRTMYTHLFTFTSFQNLFQSYKYFFTKISKTFLSCLAQFSHVLLRCIPLPTSCWNFILILSHWPSGRCTVVGKFLRCPAWWARDLTLCLRNQHLQDISAHFKKKKKKLEKYEYYYKIKAVSLETPPSLSVSVKSVAVLFHFSLARDRQMLYNSAQTHKQQHSEVNVRDWRDAQVWRLKCERDKWTESTQLYGALHQQTVKVTEENMSPNYRRLHCCAAFPLNCCCPLVLRCWI